MLFEMRVFRVDAAGHLAEAEKIALHRHAEDVEHGARPEDDAIGDVPVPHAALAAVERLVEARGGNAEHRRRPQPPCADCQWKAPPSIISTSRVTTKSVVTCVTLARHELSTSCCALEDDEAAGKAAEVLEA